MKIQPESILCCADFSDESNHGIAYGVSLAQKFTAKLYVCYVIALSAASIYGKRVSDPLAQQNRIIDYSIEYIDRLIGEQPEPFFWEPLGQIGRTGVEIIRMVDENKVDLTALATHGRSGLKRLFLGSKQNALCERFRGHS